MVDNIPAAGTPSAANTGNGGTPVPASVQTPGAPARTEPSKTFTQEELEYHISQRLAKDREAREKELGVPLKDAKTILEEYKKRTEAEKSQQQKDQDKAVERENRILALTMKNNITDALLEAGCNPKQIPKLSLRIIGETKEEIAADIAEWKKDMPQLFGGQTGTPTPPGGAHPGLPNGGTPDTPRTYRRSEIRAMSYADHIKYKNDIIRAMGVPGGIIED